MMLLDMNAPVIEAEVSENWLDSSSFADLIKVTDRVDAADEIITLRMKSGGRIVDSEKPGWKVPYKGMLVTA